MEYIIPHYFEQFQCVAAECEDTCCAGWAIMIDEESLERYRNAKGVFGDRLKNSIDWKKGCFLQQDKRCAFLNSDDLCDLHIQGGEQMLCNTCRDYPRHMEEFEGLREGSLSLSCIEAAKIILGCKEPVRFLRFEDDVEDEEYEDFDYLLFTKLMDVRGYIIGMLQSREIDIMTRIGVALDFADQLQEAIEEGEVFRIDEMLEKFGGAEMFFDFEQKVKRNQMSEIEYCSNMRKMFRVFRKLEVLKADWPEYIKGAERTLYGEGQRVYQERLQQFLGSMGEEWSIWLEQLMVYFVFTYFCGAVYDGNALGKIKIAVTATLLIRELAFAEWIEKGQQLGFDGFVDIAHRVSRELEHSDLNLIRLEKICQKSFLFSTEELLGVLLYEKIV